MQITRQPYAASTMVIYLGVIIAFIGLYLLPVWPPIFGLGIALTYGGSLHCFVESVMKQRRLGWYDFLLGAILFAVLLYVLTDVLWE